jgi:thymidylate synthase (FAD)
VSRRYVTDEPEFYEPEVWRKAADNVKQGSSDEAIHLNEITGDYGSLRHDLEVANEHAIKLYKDIIEAGVCPEQARMVLPQSMYTEWIWTGNLLGFSRVYNLRTDSHTQRVTQHVANQIGEVIGKLFPVSWKELTSQI